MGTFRELTPTHLSGCRGWELPRRSSPEVPTGVLRRFSPRARASRSAAGSSATRFSAGPRRKPPKPATVSDFASGPQRLEVKSNSSRRREHHFTLEQVTRPGKTTVVIASVFVERSGGGLSLRQLFENSRARVSNDPALLRRIDAVFYSSLGSGWADAMDEAFDWELATGSLAFYAAAAVPKPDNPAPRLVSDVRFRSDLGALAPIPTSQLRELGDIYAACAP